MGKEKEEIDTRIDDLLQLVHIAEKADYFPVQLSGGETQRVSIARALANAPDVLFADEPTGNLDEETARHIIQILKKINSIGTTVLISSHVPCDLANHTHRTFFIEHANVIELFDEDSPKSEEKQDGPVKSEQTEDQTESKLEKKDEDKQDGPVTEKESKKEELPEEDPKDKREKK